MRWLKSGGPLMLHGCLQNRVIKSKGINYQYSQHGEAAEGVQQDSAAQQVCNTSVKEG